MITAWPGKGATAGNYVAAAAKCAAPVAVFVAVVLFYLSVTHQGAVAEAYRAAHLRAERTQHPELAIPALRQVLGWYPKHRDAGYTRRLIAGQLALQEKMAFERAILQAKQSTPDRYEADLRALRSVISAYPESDRVGRAQAASTGLLEKIDQALIAQLHEARRIVERAGERVAERGRVERGDAAEFERGVSLAQSALAKFPSSSHADAVRSLTMEGRESSRQIWKEIREEKQALTFYGVRLGETLQSLRRRCSAAGIAFSEGWQPDDEVDPSEIWEIKGAPNGDKNIEKIKVKTYNGNVWWVMICFSRQFASFTYVDRERAAALETLRAQGYSHSLAAEAYDLVTHRSSAPSYSHQPSPLKKPLVAKYGKDGGRGVWTAMIAGRKVAIFLHESTAEVTYVDAALEKEILRVKSRNIHARDERERAEQRRREAERQHTLDGL